MSLRKVLLLICKKPELITLFSWNEWVEEGYLLPDMQREFGYLEAVKNSNKRRI